MFDLWKNTIIKKIQTAIYVPPGSGGTSFKDRLFHGLVLNEPSVQRDYIFSDGTVLPARENDLFYLPKGSTYHVKQYVGGGCYAINFDADINDVPFSVNVKNTNIMQYFKKACTAWQKTDDFSEMTVISELYKIILSAASQEKKYYPNSRFSVISPAEEEINQNLTSPSLSVSSLSKMCNISEAYFRRLFIAKNGISPKEYIISLRIDYAKKLLSSGEFSVYDVAVMCGYQEQCHFTREFSKRVGMSPNAFKKTVQ